jgi:hypothetical protein
MLGKPSVGTDSGNTQPQLGFLPPVYTEGVKWFVPSHPALVSEEGYDPTYKAYVDQMLSAVPPEAGTRKLKALRGEDTVDEPDEKKYMKVNWFGGCFDGPVCPRFTSTLLESSSV